MQKIRTIDCAYKEIKDADPNSALSKTYIRYLVETGQIPSVNCGVKAMFDLDELEAFLQRSLRKGGQA